MNSKKRINSKVSNNITIKPKAPHSIKLLLEINNAIVKKDYTLEELTLKYNKLIDQSNSNYISMFETNIPKLASKIPHLVRLRELVFQNQTNIKQHKWIYNWFKNNTFHTLQNEERHTMPEKYELIGNIVNDLILLHCIDNQGTIIHGSFAAHLLDRNITYVDIDISSNIDYFILVTICIILYLLCDEQYIFISIPFIINHRKISPIREPTVNICDLLHIDNDLINVSRRKVLKFGPSANGIHLHVQNLCIQMFNYFKMFNLDDRRKRIEEKKDNNMRIVNALFDHFLFDKGITEQQFMTTYYSYNIKSNIDTLNEISLELTHYNEINRFVFHCSLQDEEFIEYIDKYIVAQYKDIDNWKLKNSYLISFKQNNILPDQVIQIYTHDHNLITHINVSRNNIYTDIIDAPRTSEIELMSMKKKLSDVSVLTLLSIVGLLYFIINNYKYENILRTIINVVGKYSIRALELVYPRIKNRGDHVGVNILSTRFTRIEPTPFDYLIRVYNLHDFVKRGEELPRPIIPAGTLADYRALITKNKKSSK